MSQGGYAHRQGAGQHTRREQSHAAAREAHVLVAGPGGEGRPECDRPSQFHQRRDRQDDGGQDHQQPLQGIGDADRPEAAQQGVQQDDGAAQGDAAAAGHIEGGREGVARPLELGGDVDQEAEQDDGGDQCDDTLALAATGAQGDKFGGRQQLLPAADGHDPRRHDPPGKRTAQHGSQRHPQCRQADGEGQAAHAQQGPGGGGTGAVAHRRHPGPYLPARQEEVLLGAHPPLGPQPDQDQQDLVDDQRGQDDIGIKHPRRTIC